MGSHEMGTGKSKEERTKEKVREWQRQLRSECRHVDRDVNKLRQEEAKLTKEIKAMAAKGQPASVQTLTKQLIRSRKTVLRLERTKASLTSVNLQITVASSTMTTTSALKMSAGVMKDINRLMNVPALKQTMDELRREMAKMEILDDMMEEGFEESDDEAEIDIEVQKVYEELSLDTAMKLGPGVASQPAAVRQSADDDYLEELARKERERDQVVT